MLYNMFVLSNSKCVMRLLSNLIKELCNANLLLYHFLKKIIFLTCIIFLFRDVLNHFVPLFKTLNSSDYFIIYLDITCNYCLTSKLNIFSYNCI